MVRVWVSKLSLIDQNKAARLAVRDRVRVRVRGRGRDRGCVTIRCRVFNIDTSCVREAADPKSNKKQGSGSC